MGVWGFLLQAALPASGSQYTTTSIFHMEEISVRSQPPEFVSLLGIVLAQ